MENKQTIGQYISSIFGGKKKKEKKGRSEYQRSTGIYDSTQQMNNVVMGMYAATSEGQATRHNGESDRDKQGFFSQDETIKGNYSESSQDSDVKGCYGGNHENSSYSSGLSDYSSGSSSYDSGSSSYDSGGSW